MSFARYTLTLGTMTAILTGIGLRQIRLYKKMLVGVLVSNLAALVLLSFVQNPLASKIRSVSPVLRFVPYLHDTGEYLKRHLGPEDAVVFDNYNHEANQLMALSGMSLLAGKRAFRVPDHSDPQEQATKLAQLSSYIHDQHPKYLVYSDRGEMREYFSLPIGCSDTQVGQLSFQCVFHNAYYRIYQLGYGTNVSDSTL